MCASRDYLLLDPALSYGVTEYVRMILAAERMGWSRERFVPHGGHQANLALAAGLGLGGTECYPGVFGPIGGFAAPVEIRDGYASVVELPGIGIEAKADLWAEFAQLRP